MKISCCIRNKLKSHFRRVAIALQKAVSTSVFGTQLEPSSAGPVSGAATVSNNCIS